MTLMTVDDVTIEQTAKMIDHSLLRPELTDFEIVAGLEVAARYKVATATVRPCDVPVAVARLRGTGVGVSTVVGFPHGSHSTFTKAAEARWLVENGADELDMVINIGRLRSGEDGMVGSDISAVVQAAGGRIVKVILETAYLSDSEKVRACQIAEASGAGFVKTSTGFAPGGATFEDLS